MQLPDKGQEATRANSSPSTVKDGTPTSEGEQNVMPTSPMSSASSNAGDISDLSTLSDEDYEVPASALRIQRCTHSGVNSSFTDCQHRNLKLSRIETTSLKIPMRSPTLTSLCRKERTMTLRLLRLSYLSMQFRLRPNLLRQPFADLPTNLAPAWLCLTLIQSLPLD